MRGRSSIHSKSKRTTLFYNVVLLDLGRPYEPFLNQKLMRCCLAVLACSVSWRGEENRKRDNPLALATHRLHSGQSSFQMKDKAPPSIFPSRTKIDVSIASYGSIRQHSDSDFHLAK